jgi:hypothetical protein
LLPRWGWIVAAGLSLVAISALVTYLIVEPGGNAQNDLTWSALPHTTSCGAIDSDQIDGAVAPPPALRAEQVTVTHLDGTRVRLALRFAQPPPPPQYVTVPFTPDGGDQRMASGSATYIVSVTPKGD